MSKHAVLIRIYLSLVILVSCGLCFGAAIQVFDFTVTAKGITPSKVNIPANQKVKIVLNNPTNAGEEFEIIALDMEIGVQPKKSESFEIGPLKPGVYKFSGHEIPGGELVVK
jgi:hypothetical protein